MSSYVEKRTDQTEQETATKLHFMNGVSELSIFLFSESKLKQGGYNDITDQLNQSKGPCFIRLNKLPVERYHPTPSANQVQRKWYVRDWLHPLAEERLELYGLGTEM